MGILIGSPSSHLFLFYLVLLLICSLVLCDSPLPLHRRFEYKYSFKGPHIVQKDNSIPFWEYSGSKWQGICELTHLDLPTVILFQVQ